MTHKEAEELILNHDWAKFSDARELVLTAAQLGAKAERERIAQWLRDNYQDYPNIASLCDALKHAAKTHTA